MKKDALGGRRYWLCCAIVVAGCIMLWYGRITGAEWVSVVSWVAGIYAVANTGQRGIEAAQAVKSQ